MDKNTEIILGQMARLCTSAIAIGAAGIVHEVLMSTTVTNHEKKSVTGNKVIAPTEDVTVMESNQTTAAQTESSLASDEVSAQSGSVEASGTEAQVANTKAAAANSGATALKTQAGATDIATKALKLN
ncbi:MAG: hypothetical protein ACI4ND_00500 [Succinivibrio sp.]